MFVLPVTKGNHINCPLLTLLLNIWNYLTWLFLICGERLLLLVEVVYTMFRLVTCAVSLLGSLNVNLRRLSVFSSFRKWFSFSSRSILKNFKVTRAVSFVLLHRFWLVVGFFIVFFVLIHQNRMVLLSLNTDTLWRPILRYYPRPIYLSITRVMHFAVLFILSIVCLL